MSMSGLLLAAAAFWLGRTSMQGAPDKSAESSFQPIDKTESKSDRKDGSDSWHGWHRSWQESLKAAKESQKPIFILFTGAEWCHPCQMLERNVIASAEFQEWATDFELCVYVYPKSDERGDEFDSIQNIQGDLAGDHGVPNWAFCRSDGTVIRSGGGYRETQSAADWIRTEGNTSL